MGLAVVLTFIGVKMLIEVFHIVIPVWISLVVVATVLLISVAASLLWPKEAGMDIELELPEDFGSPFEDDAEETPVKK
jgi:predicted tellurium resistance membrane protein TerC